MSVLCDRDIRRLCEGRDDRAMILPFDEARLQPASYDVSLGAVFQEISDDRLRPVILCEPKSLASLYQRVEFEDGDIYTLSPRSFVLACTREIISVPPYLVAQIRGKSGLARAGLVIESAGYLDPGFRGSITMELFNQLHLPVVLKVGQLIAQVSFEEMTGRPQRVYGSEGLNSHYQGDRETVGSRFGT